MPEDDRETRFEALPDTDIVALNLGDEADDLLLNLIDALGEWVDHLKEYAEMNTAEPAYGALLRHWQKEQRFLEKFSATVPDGNNDNQRRQ